MHPFRSGGLSRINMRDDTDITYSFQWVFSSHWSYYKSHKEEDVEMKIQTTQLLQITPELIQGSELYSFSSDPPFYLSQKRRKQIWIAHIQKQ